MYHGILSSPLDQLLSDASQRLKGLITSEYMRVSRIYLGILLLVTAGFLLAMPVGSGDTDLWYHLNGGRLLWEFDQFPSNAFYSFVDSKRWWVNYFWGFQALTYQVHRLTGYEGLIGLRVVLVLLTFGALTLLMVRPNDNPTQRVWALLVVVLAMLVLVGRTDLIRPHLVSYLMIPVFLVILEYYRRWLPVLPLLTVFWVNLHGVEWPVGALICGSYFLEAGWRLFRGRSADTVSDRRLLLWLLACIPALMVNPYGVLIIAAPFSTPADAYAYIRELEPYSLWSLFSINLTGPVITVAGAIALLSWGNLFAYSLLFLRRQVRFAPLIMSVASLILMARGTRFIWEWVLLSLPLWRSAIDVTQDHVTNKKENHIGIGDVIVTLVLLSPVVSWGLQAKAFYHWPLDKENLPIGAMDFLAKEKVAGRILAPPSFGGYIAWRLYPQILISGDMQLPPTIPWDHYRGFSAVRNADALERFLNQFHPNLIAVDLARKSFAKLIGEHGNYRPVFFDDKLVLYADAAQLPELVRRYELHHINPFNLLDDHLGTTDQRIAELRRVLQFQPNGDRVQHGLTRILFKEKRFVDALLVAQRYAESVPENPNSEYMLGNVLENLDRFEEARGHYLAAMKVAAASFLPELYRHLGACAYLEKDLASAYGYFERGVNPYIQNVDPEYLYQYALSALAVGKDERARMLTNQLLYSVSPKNTSLVKKARALLADL